MKYPYPKKTNNKIKPILKLITYELNIYINSNWGNDPNRGRHSFVIKGNKQTTEWRERQHARIYIEEWNKGVESVNKYEEEVCFKCYAIQLQMLVNSYNQFQIKYLIKNKEFDSQYSGEYMDIEIIYLQNQLLVLQNELMDLREQKNECEL